MCLFAWCSYLFISQKVLKKLISSYISCVYLLGVLIYYLPESVEETHQWLHFLCLLAWCSYLLSPTKLWGFWIPLVSNLLQIIFYALPYIYL